MFFSSSKKLNKEQKEFETLENEITMLEAGLQTITEQLNNPDLSHEELLDISQKIEETNKIIEEKSFRWMELSE